MKSPEQIELALFGSLAPASYWTCDVFPRMSLFHVPLDAAEIMRFEGYRLEKTFPEARAHFDQWAINDAVKGGRPELIAFREDLEELRDLRRVVSSGAGAASDGPLIKEAVWHYLQAVEKDHQRDLASLQMDVQRDARELGSDRREEFLRTVNALSSDCHGDADGRSNARKDGLRALSDLAELKEGRDCPSLMLRFGWLLATVARERVLAMEALEKCVKASKGSATATNWMAHRLLGALAASEGDFAVADFWLLQGATMRNSAFALFEAALYAGRNDRTNECRLLYTRALEAQPFAVLLALADDETSVCRESLFDAFGEAQNALRAEGRSMIMQWGAAASAAEDAAVAAGIESIASQNLLKEHHRFGLLIHKGGVLLAGFMGQRAVVSRKYLIDEATLTLQREFQARQERIDQVVEAIDRETALRLVKIEQAREAREVEVGRARQSHKQSLRSYKGVELGCSIAFGLGVAAVGTFLTLAVICGVNGTSFGIDSPIGLVIIVGGMAPVGLMMATHVVHGIFGMRATGELAAMLKRAEREYQTRLEAIDRDFESRMIDLHDDLASKRHDLDRARAGLAKFGVEPADPADLMKKAA